MNAGKVTVTPSSRPRVVQRPGSGSMQARSAGVGATSPPNYRHLGFNLNALKSEQARLDTFRSRTSTDNTESIWPTPFIKPEDCAKAGFFFLRDGDKVQCAFCRGVVGEWEAGDVPFTEHKKHFPRCPFVCKLPFGNIPIGQEAHEEEETEEEEAIGVDVCGPFLPIVRPYARPDEEEVHHVRGAQPLKSNMDEVANNLAIRTGTGPAKKHLVTQESRLETFESWPRCQQSAEAMSEAGFYYIGISDHVKCFYCDGGLRNWEPNDDPWIEHVRWFSQCPFVLLNKGREFKATPTITNNEDNDEAVVPELPGKSTDKVPIRTDTTTLPCPSSTCSSSSGSGASSPGADSGEFSGSDDDQSVDPKEKQPQKKKQKGQVTRDLEEEVRTLKQARQCKICMDNEADVVFLPCGHLISCVRCATALSTCALCRQQIKAVVRTYMA